MNFFTKLFKKKLKEETPPMPSWETVVEMMYDKHLDAFSDEIVKVIYSKDRILQTAPTNILFHSILLRQSAPLQIL